MSGSIRKTTISVELQRLGIESQARLDWMLEHNNEGRLTPAEREELQGFIARYENLLLQHTATLLRATRPDLVDASGRIHQARLTRAARRTARFLHQSSGS